MKNFASKLTLQKKLIAKLNENAMSYINGGGGVPTPESWSCRPGGTRPV